MAVYHRTITCLTTATTIQALFGTAIPNNIKFLSIQADAGNDGLVYIGGSADGTLSSSDYAFRIETPVTNIPYAPMIIELAAGLYNAADLKIIASSTTQKIHCLVITS